MEKDNEEVLIQLSEKDLDNFKKEQNYTNGLIMGIVAGLAGATLWGIITVVTKFQIGYMAIAIGAGVGVAIKHFGKGIDKVFGITGAVIALMSCVLGNFFSSIGFIAFEQGLDFFETLFMFTMEEIISLMGYTFSPMDLFFYAIAAYEGYKFSFRSFTEKELHELKKMG